MLKKLPRKGQFDLEGIYTDFFVFPFFKALFHFAWLSGELRKTMYLVLFSQDVKCLGKKKLPMNLIWPLKDCHNETKHLNINW